MKEIKEIKRIILKKCDVKEENFKDFYYRTDNVSEARFIFVMMCLEEAIYYKDIKNEIKCYLAFISLTKKNAEERLKKDKNLKFLYDICKKEYEELKKSKPGAYCYRVKKSSMSSSCYSGFFNNYYEARKWYRVNGRRLEKLSKIKLTLYNSGREVR
jgi:hypothetical protein